MNNKTNTSQEVFTFEYSHFSKDYLVEVTLNSLNDGDWAVSDYVVLQADGQSCTMDIDNDDLMNAWEIHLDTATF